MKPLSFIELNGNVACDVVAAPNHDDCLSLCRYFEKYWEATIVEEFDTGFAARFSIYMSNRSVTLTHDSQIGNVLSSPPNDITKVIPDILEDLNRRLCEVTGC